MTAVIERDRDPWWIEGLYRNADGYVFDGVMDADTFAEAVIDVGRNNGPALLCDVYGQGAIDIAMYPGVVADVWSSAEYPARSLDPDMWVELFEEAAYTHDGQPAPRPSRPVTLYRGCIPDCRFGMSWTTDMATARRFAGGLLCRRQGHVYVHLAERGELLAYIHTDSGRGEAEYVIDPYFLDDNNVRVIEGAR